MSVSGSAALEPETIANSMAVSAEPDVIQLMTAAFKEIQSGNQEAKVAVESVPGATHDIVEIAKT